MSKFTPGPWEVRYGMSGKARTVNPVLNWNSLARKGHDAEANGRLIAAAPELLNALQGLLADIIDYQTINKLGGENNHWQVIARAAIRKATGDA